MMKVRAQSLIALLLAVLLINSSGLNVFAGEQTGATEGFIPAQETVVTEAVASTEAVTPATEAVTAVTEMVAPAAEDIAADASASGWVSEDAGQNAVMSTEAQYAMETVSNGMVISDEDQWAEEASDDGVVLADGVVPEVQQTETSAAGFETQAESDALFMDQEVEATASYFTASSVDGRVNVQITLPGGAALPESTIVTLDGAETTEGETGSLVKSILTAFPREVSGMYVMKISLTDVNGASLALPAGSNLQFTFSYPLGLNLTAERQGRIYFCSSDGYNAYEVSGQVNLTEDGLMVNSAQYTTQGEERFAIAGVQNRANTGEYLTADNLIFTLGAVADNAIIAKSYNGAMDAVVPAGVSNGASVPAASSGAFIQTVGGDESMFVEMEDSDKTQSGYTESILEPTFLALSQYSAKLADAQSSDTVKVINLTAASDGSLNLANTELSRGEIDVRNYVYVINVVAPSDLMMGYHLQLPQLLVKETQNDGSYITVNDSNNRSLAGRVIINALEVRDNMYAPFEGVADGGYGVGTYLMPEGTLQLKSLIGAAYADNLTIEGNAVAGATLTGAENNPVEETTSTELVSDPEAAEDVLTDPETNIEESFATAESELQTEAGLLLPESESELESETTASTEEGTIVPESESESESEVESEAAEGSLLPDVEDESETNDPNALVSNLSAQAGNVSVDIVLQDASLSGAAASLEVEETLDGENASLVRNTVTGFLREVSDIYVLKLTLTDGDGQIVDLPAGAGLFFKFDDGLDLKLEPYRQADSFFLTIGGAGAGNTDAVLVPTSEDERKLARAIYTTKNNGEMIFAIAGVQNSVNAGAPLSSTGLLSALGSAADSAVIAGDYNGNGSTVLPTEEASSSAVIDEADGSTFIEVEDYDKTEAGDTDLSGLSNTLATSTNGNGVVVARLAYTDGNVPSPLSDTELGPYLDENGSISLAKTGGNLLVVNLIAPDTTSTIQLPALNVTDGTNTVSNDANLAGKVIYNVIGRSGDSYSPYTGTAVGAAGIGTYLAPYGSLEFQSGLIGAAYANTVNSNGNVTPVTVTMASASDSPTQAVAATENTSIVGKDVDATVNGDISLDLEIRVYTSGTTTNITEGNTITYSVKDINGTEKVEKGNENIKLSTTKANNTIQLKDEYFLELEDKTYGNVTVTIDLTGLREGYIIGNAQKKVVLTLRKIVSNGIPKYYLAYNQTTPIPVEVDQSQSASNTKNIALIFHAELNSDPSVLNLYSLLAGSTNQTVENVRIKITGDITGDNFKIIDTESLIDNHDGTYTIVSSPARIKINSGSITITPVDSNAGEKYKYSDSNGKILDVLTPTKFTLKDGAIVNDKEDKVTSYTLYSKRENFVLYVQSLLYGTNIPVPGIQFSIHQYNEGGKRSTTSYTQQQGTSTSSTGTTNTRTTTGTTTTTTNWPILTNMASVNTLATVNNGIVTVASRSPNGMVTLLLDGAEVNGSFADGTARLAISRVKPAAGYNFVDNYGYAMQTGEFEEIPVTLGADGYTLMSAQPIIIWSNVQSLPLTVNLVDQTGNNAAPNGLLFCLLDGGNPINRGIMVEGGDLDKDTGMIKAEGATVTITFTDPGLLTDLAMGAVSIQANTPSQKEGFWILDKEGNDASLGLQLTMGTAQTATAGKTTDSATGVTNNGLKLVPSTQAAIATTTLPQNEIEESPVTIFYGYTPNWGKITVKKAYYLTDGTQLSTTAQQTAYVALFSDPQGMRRVAGQDVKPITVAAGNHKSSDGTAAVFSGLAHDKVYYVFETDQSGAPITDSNLQVQYKFGDKTSDTSPGITVGERRTAKASRKLVIKNMYDELPDGFSTLSSFQIKVKFIDERNKGLVQTANATFKVQGGGFKLAADQVVEIQNAVSGKKKDIQFPVSGDALTITVTLMSLTDGDGNDLMSTFSLVDPDNGYGIISDNLKTFSLKAGEKNQGPILFLLKRGAADDGEDFGNTGETEDGVTLGNEGETEGISTSVTTGGTSTTGGSVPGTTSYTGGGAGATTAGSTAGMPTSDTATLTITKAVTYKGQPIRVNATYYVGIFSDEAHTQKLFQKTMSLSDASSKSSELKVNLARLANKQITLYFAEVDKNGTVVNSGSTTGYNIQIDTPSITLTPTNYTATVTVTNEVLDGTTTAARLTDPTSGFAGDAEALSSAQTLSQTPGDAAALTSAQTQAEVGSLSTRTGDTNPIMLFVIIAAAAALVILILVIVLIRRSKTKKKYAEIAKRF